MKLRCFPCLAGGLAILAVTSLTESAARPASDGHLNESAGIFRAAQTSKQGVLTPEQTGPYFALLIGINDYQHLPKLKTAVQDAEGVAAILHDQYGFETTILRNPSGDQIKRALNAYRRELERNSNLLIYYAGHGFYDKEADKAYWLPVDAEPGDTTNWIIADEITTDAKVMPSRHVLIVSDSCYSGGISRGVTAEFTPQEQHRYLEKMLEGKSRTLMASGGLEPVSDVGERGHSVFAAALMGGLNSTQERAFSAQILFEHSVRISVAGRSEQTPEYTVIRNSGHDAGDFVFLRRSGAANPEASAAESSKPAPRRPPPKQVAAAAPEPEPTRETVAETPPPAVPAGGERSAGASPEPANLPASESVNGVSTAAARSEFQAMKTAFNAGIAAMNIANQIADQMKALRDDDQKSALQQKRATSCEVAAGRFQEAEQAAPREAAGNVMSVAASNHAIVWANLGLAYECLGRYEDAIVSFRKAAALRPQANYYAHLSEAVARAAVATHDEQLIQSQVGRANYNCERAAAIDPNSGAICWKNLGNIYYTSLSMKQAVPALRKATEADPSDAHGWYLLGSALAAGITSEREGGRTIYKIPPGTRKAYLQCLEVDPGGPYAKACQSGLDAIRGMTPAPREATQKEPE